MMIYSANFVFAEEKAIQVNYTKEAAILYELGLFQGLSSTEFIPALEKNTNREQAMKMLAVALQWNIDATAKSQYTDVSIWAQPYVAKAVQLGITKGKETGKFGGADAVTVKEMCTWILRSMGHDGQIAWKDTNNLADQMLKLNISDKENLALNRDLLVKVIYNSLQNGKVIGEKYTLIEKIVFGNPTKMGIAKKGNLIDESFDELPQLESPKSGEQIAVMTTTMGTIKIRLFPQYAPKAVENFITHSQNGYYDGLLFHRVIHDFMIQGGDPLGDGKGGVSIWGKPFADEFSGNVFNFRGALSMANAGPNTNGSQFFFVQKATVENQMLKEMLTIGYPQNIIDHYAKVGGTPWLDFRHTVFGHIFEGLEIVDQIAVVKVGANDKPKKDVVIQKVEIVDFK